MSIDEKRPIEDLLHDIGVEYGWSADELRSHFAEPAPESPAESPLERIAQAVQEGAAAQEWSGELLAKLLDEVRALSLLVQAPSRRADPLPEAVSMVTRRPECVACGRVLWAVESAGGDRCRYCAQRADARLYYQARLGRLSDHDLAAEVASVRDRHLQAEREQRTRQQMREAADQKNAAKSST